MKFLAVIYLVWVAFPCCYTEYVDIMTGSGPVRGTTERVLKTDVNIFSGIPFAKPPVGRQRFRRPVLIEKWKDPVNATRMPNSCFQSVDTAFNRFSGVEMWNPNTPMSEDCLYLNIWAPSKDLSTRARAVMVWIYGGGFYAGSSTLDIYDGRILAASSDVVVVSMQYRVGTLGFLYLGIPEAPGNMGMLDQQTALQWIYNYISSFGGDNRRITVFGESAGAASTSLHLLSPLSQNLIKSAIMESGSAICTWAVDPVEVAKTKALDLAKRVGCDTNQTYDILSCLLKADPTALTDKMWNLADDSIVQTPISPTIDNYFLREPPVESMQRAAFKKTSILLGVNQDEGSYIVVYEEPKTFNDTITRAEFLKDLEARVGTLNELVQEVVSFEYGVPNKFSSKVTYREILYNVFGDNAFICPVVDFAKYYAESKQNVYLYLFNHRSSANPWPMWMGVMHGYEIDHVFGLPLNSSHSYTKDEVALSKSILKYWTNFAKSGDPNLGEDGEATGYQWPTYTKTEQKYLVLKTNFSRVDTGLRDRQCRFWRQLVPKLQAQSHNNPHTCGAKGIQTSLTSVVFILIFLHSGLR